MKKLLCIFVALFAAINLAFAAIDINTASEVELDKLPGIGPVKAKAIVADRKKNGPFKSPEDIKRVKGIGNRIYDELKGQISVGGKSVPAAAPAPRVQAKPVPAVIPAPATTAAKPAATPAPAAAKSADAKKDAEPADSKSTAKDEKDAAKDAGKGKKKSGAKDAKSAKDGKKEDKPVEKK